MTKHYLKSSKQAKDLASDKESLDDHLVSFKQQEDQATVERLSLKEKPLTQNKPDKMTLSSKEGVKEKLGDKKKLKSSKERLARQMRYRTGKLAQEQVGVNEDVETFLEKKTELENAYHTAKRLGYLGKQGLTTGADVGVTIGQGLGNQIQKWSSLKGSQYTVKARNNSVRRLNPLRKQARKQAVQMARKSALAIIYGTRAVVSRPWLLALVGGLVVLFLLLFSLLGSTVTIQDEYDLNQTYLSLTQRDRENSNDQVTYWTNWETPLLYLNYQYDELQETYRFSDEYALVDTKEGRFLINRLWDDLNSDKTNLKSMKDLYQDKESSFYLEGEDQEQFEELLENGKELGTFYSLVELENPFYSTEDDKSDDPIAIAKRMGYTTKDKVSEETTLNITANHELFAVMTGTVRIDGKTLTIETSDTRFTYYEVASMRVTDGQTVQAGDLLGVTNPSGNQLVRYEKELTYRPAPTLDNLFPKETTQWVVVNPGFYFKHVTYLQETYVSQTAVDSETAKRVMTLYNYYKKLIPETTVQGVAAIAGNFDIESGIKAKRAEGDYLPPPIGATDMSWDDETWLSMSGPQIYAGAYTNILKRGLGLGMWTDTADGGTRHSLLLSYAQSKQKSWYDLELQMDFMLNGDSENARIILRNILTSTRSTEELTNEFLILWEGNSGDKLAVRQASAKKWESYINLILSGGEAGISSQTVPDSYKDKLVYGLPSDQAVKEGLGYPGNAYALGNCTWYVYNRFAQIGVGLYAYLGDAGNWPTSAQARGYEVTTTPKVGTAVVFAPGVAGAHPIYGHVSFVEHVNEDGSFLVSEMNAAGLYNMTWRTLHYQPGMTFITPR